METRESPPQRFLGGPVALGHRTACSEQERVLEGLMQVMKSALVHPAQRGLHHLCPELAPSKHPPLGPESASSGASGSLARMLSAPEAPHRMQSASSPPLSSQHPARADPPRGSTPRDGWMDEDKAEQAEPE